MAAFLRYCLEMHDYVFIELADPRIGDYFLMGSPLSVILIIVVYYYFLFHGGQKLMENRKPFDLKNIMMVFNLFQIAANFYLVCQLLPFYFIVYKSNMCCLSIDVIPETDRDAWLPKIMFWRHFYVMLKIFDLMDTVFMVLKKNYHQITFLHVYHHIGMALGTWLIIKFSTSNHEGFTAGLNAIIHMFMYTYYLVSLNRKGIKNSIWWKKFITQLQLIQFGLIFIHHMITLLDPQCSVPKLPILLYITQVVLMIVMFSNFYYKAYIRPQKVTKANSNYKQQ